MGDILFLAHRIPYPPNKGDKIRSWHMLAHLAKRHRVYLGCFVDDPSDFAHVPFLQDVCTEVMAVPLDPRLAKSRSLKGLLRGEALSIGYYRDHRLDEWVGRISTAHDLAATILFSSPMAQYVLERQNRVGRVVMDFVDVDSDKWRQYAEAKRWPLSLVYRREARALLKFERRVAMAADSSLFVSPKEAELFRQLAPEAAHKIGHLNNGVDYGYFSPEHRFPSPFMDGEQPIVFTGAMDYWANVDAVDWFARAILPQIRAVVPAAVFTIVGGNPAPKVKALAALPGITVTGRVPDVRPYLAHAAVVVCPLRIARGIQNKLLEGMAMARPVVATSQAFEGIEAEPGRDLLLADTPAGFAADVLQILAGEHDADMGRRARKRVMETYSWDSNLQSLDEQIAPPGRVMS